MIRICILIPYCRWISSRCITRARISSLWGTRRSWEIWFFLTSRIARIQSLFSEPFLTILRLGSTNVTGCDSQTLELTIYGHISLIYGMSKWIWGWVVGTISIERRVNQDRRPFAISVRVLNCRPKPMVGTKRVQIDRFL